jgi:hypothetical protein
MQPLQFVGGIGNGFKLLGVGEVLLDVIGPLPHLLSELLQIGEGGFHRAGACHAESGQA